MATDTDPDTEPDADANVERSLWRAGFRVLLTVTVLVAVVTFALSFYGLNDFGRTGMGLPIWLSPLVPIGVDLFSLCGIAATYMLRLAEARIRAYAWLVFLVPTGLSVAGNMAHAEHRALGRAGVVGAAVAPVVLALSAHLVVVVRRHVERADTDPDIAADAVPTASGQATTSGTAPSGTAGADSEEVAAMGRAVAVRRRGGTVAEQALAAGVDERTIRRWFGQPPRRPPARRGTTARPSPNGRGSDTAQDDGTAPAGHATEG